MATSNPGALLPAAGRWLSSTKSITGSALAIAGLGAHAFIGLGTFWPLVIASAYGVGALAAPRDKVNLHLDLAAGAADNAADLTAQIASLRAASNIQSRRLEDDASALLSRTLDTLDQIAGRWTVVSASPEHSYTVERIAFEYLPASIQGYLNLPRSFALTARQGKRTAHDELLDQLGVLDVESARIRDAAYDQELDALSVQGQFLRDKFRQSGLTLG